ncbi:Serine/threonine protein kinase [Streptomyces sp. 3213]|uniref:serine/threonine-protein kinase n=1 Tax=Streptomyces sp. 3213.3 TaxID=1855348 RepID=UPI00089CB1FE|nr:serine/threonine-protein kinase [Streptomyces sp. 3213.3]SED89742.1 Serine/threonine protein kinase [Streptomyces sp. 3213] [Streptomyces sp. 3213.3]
MEKLGAADPQRIGAYRLLGRLGAGGMGQVYLARSDRGRTVAVKLVREDLAAQEEFRARFRQEVQAARQVGGHWTAPVLDADTEAAVPWVATGYVAGPTLQQVVGRDHGALPERSVRILAAGLAHALQDIHAAGIVHRDLKPSNVLVTIDGPRVIDFGIARALETQAGDGLTRTGSLVGSPGFMAPEQVRGDRITPACDVFCLGSVLAYAATGTLPFGSAGSGVHALMFRIAQEEPDLTGVPEGIAELVRDCLRKDPATRPTLDHILDRTGAEDTVSGGRSREPWLPSGLVAQLGRHAVRLLDTEDPQTAERVQLEKGSAPVVRALQARASEPLALEAAQGITPDATPAPAPPVPPAPAPAPAAPVPPAPAPAAPVNPPPVPEASPEHSPASDDSSPPPPAPADSGAPTTHLPTVVESRPGPAGTPPPPAPHPAYGHPQQHPQPAPGYGYPQPPAQPTPPAADYGHPQLPAQQLVGWGGQVPYNPYPHNNGLGSTPPYGPGPYLEPQESRRSKRSTALLVLVALVVALGAGGSVYALMKGGGNGSRTAAGSGGRATSAAPTTPGPTTGEPSTTDSPSPSVTPSGADAVPSGYLGTWNASIDNSTGHNTRQLTIRQGKVGDPVLKLVADGPGYHCVFSADLAQQPGGKGPLAIGASTVTSGQPLSSCSPGAASEVTLLSDGTLQRVNTGNGEKLTYTKSG